MIQLIYQVETPCTGFGIRDSQCKDREIRNRVLGRQCRAVRAVYQRITTGCQTHSCQCSKRGCIGCDAIDCICTVAFRVLVCTQVKQAGDKLTSFV